MALIVLSNALTGCASLKWAQKEDAPPTAPINLAIQQNDPEFVVKSLGKNQKTLASQIKLRLDSRAGQFISCQNRNNGLKNQRIDLQFVIDRTGSVATARTRIGTQNQTTPASFESCLVSVVKSIRFHSGKESSLIEVKYPLYFKPSSNGNVAGYRAREIERQKNLKKAQENRTEKRLLTTT